MARPRAGQRDLAVSEAVISLLAAIATHGQEAIFSITVANVSLHLARSANAVHLHPSSVSWLQFSYFCSAELT
jgi:hypothetical protein